MIHVNTSGHRGRYNNSKVGRFKPVNPQKYNGETPIIFKSGLEQKLMRFLDRSPNVIQWAYENISIKYKDYSTNPPKVRNYHIDFVAKVKSGANTTKTLWIEVKSSKEVQEPSKDKAIEYTTWVKNQCKWKSASMLAESKGYQFKIITEKELD